MPAALAVVLELRLLQGLKNAAGAARRADVWGRGEAGIARRDASALHASRRRLDRPNENRAPDEFHQARRIFVPNGGLVRDQREDARAERSGSHPRQQPLRHLFPYHPPRGRAEDSLDLRQRPLPRDRRTLRRQPLETAHVRQRHLSDDRPPAVARSCGNFRGHAARASRPKEPSGQVGRRRRSLDGTAGRHHGDHVFTRRLSPATSPSGRA